MPGTRTPTVFVVDADVASVQVIRSLLEPRGLPVRSFARPGEFLEEYAPAVPGCLILDLHRPGTDGLDVLEQLAAHGVGLPIIIVTGEGDVRSCARAFKMGVVDFLQKPIDGGELLDCVLRAVAEGAASPAQPSQAMGAALAQLTPRERSIFELLVTGKTLKQIAARCGVTVQSVWKHQQHIFNKFKVQNEVELVNLMRN
jgi:two-component system response regulator DctR